MVVDATIQVKAKPKDVPIMREFLDIFSSNIQRLPPEQEMSFTINLAPGMTSISKTLYRMALVKLKELKAQL